MYFPKLDSVRCYAAFAVVFAHIFQIWLWDPATVVRFPIGNTGVVVFFVLSGFLITSLLLSEPLDKPLGQSFKNFYVRRTLRIFPIYYLYLLLAFSFNHDNIRETGVWTWLYLSNFLIFAQNAWLDSNSHLWSLSVEEQFYLVIPFLVLFFRQQPRLLLGLFSTICAASVLTRYYLSIAGYSDSPQIEVFTFANLDFLAVGALLALARRAYGERLARFGLPLLFGGLIVYALSTFLHPLGGHATALYWSLGKLAIGLASVGLLIYSIYSTDRMTVLHNPITVHLGKISYGIYLYHNPIVASYAAIMAAVGIDTGDSLLARMLISLLLVIVVAELSYALIERPLLNLKDRFR